MFVLENVSNIYTLPFLLHTEKVLCLSAFKLYVSDV